jgi:hypothetical protein
VSGDKNGRIITPFADKKIAAAKPIVMHFGGTPCRVMGDPNAILVAVPEKNVLGHWTKDPVEFLCNQLGGERAAIHALSREVAHLRGLVAKLVELADVHIETEPPWGGAWPDPAAASTVETTPMSPGGEA